MLAFDVFCSLIVAEKCKKLFSLDGIENLIHRLGLIDIWFVCLFTLIMSRIGAKGYLL
jgi:hypothetical protein